LVVLLTNGLVHESEVLSPQYFSTNLACNASGVVVLLVGDSTSLSWTSPFVRRTTKSVSRVAASAKKK
jgi:hypothetical protein